MIKVIMAIMLVGNMGFTQIPQQNEIYQIDATVRNFKTTIEYNNGETWYKHELEFTDTNGRRWVSGLVADVIEDGTEFRLTIDANSWDTFEDDTLVSVEVKNDRMEVAK